MAKARRFGQATRDPVTAIYDRSVQRQARSLLFDALALSFGVNNLDMRKILHSLRNHDRAGAYDFKGMIDMLEIVEDTARDLARDCRERMGYAA